MRQLKEYKQFILYVAMSFIITSLVSLDTVKGNTCANFFSLIKYINVTVNTHNIQGTIVPSIPLIRPNPSQIFRGLVFQGQSLKLKPIDGIGHLLVISSNLGSVTTPIWSSLLRSRSLAERLSRYDIYADYEKIIFPDDIRLNYLLRQEHGRDAFQIYDIPSWRSQHYTEIYFLKILSELGKIPTSSHVKSADFFHDKFEEHLVGGIFLPHDIFNRFRNFSFLVREVKDIPELRKYKEVKEYIYNSANLLSQNWDLLTMIVGRTIYAITVNSDKNNVDLISQLKIDLAKLFLEFDIKFSIYSTQTRMDSIIQRLSNDASVNRDRKQKILAQLEELQRLFLSPQLGSAWATENASNTVDQL